MIHRYQEAEYKKLLGLFPVVGILGTRQIGKTTFTKGTQNLVDKKVIHIDLESPSDMQKLTSPEDYFKERMNDCIIIDEVQIMPELFSIIRPSVDAHRVPARFVLLGSASPSIIKNASESLTGRIAYIELAGLNLIEVGFENLNRNWFRGGYPDAYLAKDDESSTIWLNNFIDNYIKRDLPQLGLNTSSENIRRFWQMVAHYNGGIWNGNAFANSLKLDSKTVERYRDFMSGAFLINILPPFHTNIKKRLVKSPKVYVRDSGILHRLLRVSNMEELYSNLIIGKSWEGFVYEQIRQLKNRDIELSYFRTHNGAEVDLVFSKANKVLATAEIKLTNAPKTSKGQTESIKSLNSEKNFIITPNSDDYLIHEDIRVCSIATFIKEYLGQIK